MMFSAWPGCLHTIVSLWINKKQPLNSWRTGDMLICVVLKNPWKNWFVTRKMSLLKKSWYILFSFIAFCTSSEDDSKEISVQPSDVLYFNRVAKTGTTSLVKLIQILSKRLHYGPTQVKCWLLISSFFYVMNFRHFLEMLELNLWHFWKMSEIHYIKNARNQKSTFDLRWPYMLHCL